MKPNRTLLAMVTDRAMENYVGDTEDMNTWHRHWFATAIQIRDDFTAQGLITTADAVSTLIEWNKKYAMAGS